jgi:hypothetical protein
MIDQKILDDPRYKQAVAKFTTSVRMYWRKNVGQYFNRRNNYWGLPTKMDHRISISTGGELRLRNALEVKWNPSTGHVTVRPGKLMVAGKASPYNLIDLLANTHQPSPGAYLVSSTIKGKHVEIDARIKRGTRGVQENDQWIKWMNNFVDYVDKQMKVLADEIGETVADSLVSEINTPEEF